MTLKDIILTTAMYLGREDVIAYLQNPNTSTENTDVLSVVDNLTRCVNLVINELSASYFPLIKEENVTTENNKIRYDSLSETAVQIVEIVDEYENKVNFEICPEYVLLYQTNVKVRYKYIPCNLGLDSQAGYQESVVPTRVLAYGTASEFCLTEKGFNESLLWRNRFCDALGVLLKPKNSKIKDRRFFV